MELNIFFLVLLSATKVLSSSDAEALPAYLDGLEVYNTSQSNPGRNGLGPFVLPCNHFVWMTRGISSISFGISSARRCRWGFIAPSRDVYLDITCPVFEIGSFTTWSRTCPNFLGDNFSISSPRTARASFCKNTGPQNHRAKFFAFVRFAPSLLSIIFNKKPRFSCIVTVVSPTTTSSITTTTAPKTTTTTSTTTTQRKTTTSSTTTSSTTTQKTCKCGQRGPPSQSNARIVGGIDATPNEFPFQGGLVLSTVRSQVYCSAIVISSLHVLTAAHCVTNPNIVSVSEVVLGEHDTSTTADNAIYRSIARVITHPDFNPVSLDSDIAILELSSPVDIFNSAIINPICLPNASNPYVNVSSSVSGWGLLSTSGVQPQILQVANVTTLSNSNCDALFSDRNITANMICAASPGRDACQGDSGGPLFVMENGNFELIGVVSFGIMCANPLFPGVYTRVGNFIDWINSNIVNGTTCA